MFSYCFVELLLQSATSVGYCFRKKLILFHCFICQAQEHIFAESNKLIKSIQVLLNALNELRLCYVMERFSFVPSKQGSTKVYHTILFILLFYIFILRFMLFWSFQFYLIHNAHIFVFQCAKPSSYGSKSRSAYGKVRDSTALLNATSLLTSLWKKVIFHDMHNVLSIHPCLFFCCLSLERYGRDLVKRIFLFMVEY